MNGEKFMRACGILLPIFSLPSKYGIGTFGKEAFRFVDFLEKSGQSYWQILPLCPTNFGDSPYQSFSCFAGNPYFIDIEKLIDESLIDAEAADSCDFGDDSHTVDYGKLYKNRLPLLRQAFNRFIPDREYYDFVAANSFWLEDYALFMALKKANRDISWEDWDEPYRKHRQKATENAKTKYFEDINFHKFLQYQFYRQWSALKKYANHKKIRIIGDIPIYVAYDSADVWAHPELFQLDKELRPKIVAGCPPDNFSPTGQLWGNPIYDWKLMKKDNFAWWKNYIGHALSLYNMIRIDHFRGFESYYAIPYGETTAENGRWIKGPGIDLFNAVKKQFGKDLPIIAEDLGFLTPDVLDLLKQTAFPGMKVLQFAFDPDLKSEYLPHNFGSNCVVYTGTHDNNTIMGWYDTAAKEEVDTAKEYMNFHKRDGFNWAMMRLAMMSVADTCILMMNDIIGLNTEARINTPSTVGSNWKWRIDSGCINDWLAKLIYDNTKIYGRLPE